MSREELLSRISIDPNICFGKPCDPNLIQICRTEGRCLVTLDMDFSNPLRFKPSDYSGIAVLRLPSKPTPQDMRDAIQTLIARLTQADITGRLWIVQRGKVRNIKKKTDHLLKILKVWWVSKY